ncbi:MAG: family 78 glycoside hydrolase catalytic domain [Verrucomicrobia bacterium]|nr:family 78 glycoside hydrolase catalytic domain [Verrucomicrobiota bacterium]
MKTYRSISERFCLGLTIALACTASIAKSAPTGEVVSKLDWSAQWLQAPRAALVGNPAFEFRERLVPYEQLQTWPAVPKGEFIEGWTARAMTTRNHGMPQEIGESFNRDRLAELQPAPIFRRDFVLAKSVQKAVLHIETLGVQDILINGVRISDRFWDPADANFENLHYYTSFDVARFLHTGTNTLAVMVGDGWYGQSVAYNKPDKAWRYGDPKFRAQLEVSNPDGSSERIATGPDWRVSLNGPIVKQNLWAGEIYDARRLPDWAEPGADLNSRDWVIPQVVATVPGISVPQGIPPMRVVERPPVKAITQPKPGVWVLDFGRLINGTLRARLDEPKNKAVFISFGQSLDLTGGVSKTPSVTTFAIGLFVSAGKPFEWTPRFTWQPFRYIQIEGLSSPPNPDDFEALFLANDLKRAATFSCSDPFLNELHAALVRTTQANMTHKLTDCASRERKGWMLWPNQRAVFANFQADSFFEKVEADLRTSPSKKTGFPKAMPGMSPGNIDSFAPEQIAATILLTWERYVRYGDLDSVRSQYPWLSDTAQWLLARIGKDGLVTGGWGDWHDALPNLDAAYRSKVRVLRGHKENPSAGGYPVNTPPEGTQTAFVRDVMVAMAAIESRLGNGDAAKAYTAKAEELKSAFNKAYLDPDAAKYRWTDLNGKTYESQGLYACALYYDIVPEALRAKVTSNLVRHIEEDCKGHFSTGQLLTDHVIKALAREGRGDVAYAMLTAEGFHGFKKILSYGGQMTWETWGENIMNNTPPESPHLINAGRPQEHCQFVAVDTFFYESVLGLQPDAGHPGYERFFLRPSFIPQLEWAEGSYESPHGTIRSAWKRKGSKTIEWNVTVPPNTAAAAEAPAGMTFEKGGETRRELAAGTHQISLVEKY